MYCGVVLNVWRLLYYKRERERNRRNRCTCRLWRYLKNEDILPFYILYTQEVSLLPASLFLSDCVPLLLSVCLSVFLCCVAARVSICLNDLLALIASQSLSGGQTAASSLLSLHLFVSQSLSVSLSLSVAGPVVAAFLEDQLRRQREDCPRGTVSNSNDHTEWSVCACERETENK